MGRSVNFANLVFFFASNSIIMYLYRSRLFKFFFILQEKSITLEKGGSPQNLILPIFLCSNRNVVTSRSDYHWNAFLFCFVFFQISSLIALQYFKTPVTCNANLFFTLPWGFFHLEIFFEDIELKSSSVEN